MAQSNEAVCDLETLDTDPTALVLSIGFWVFSPNEVDTPSSIERDLSERSFYAVLDVSEQIAAHRTVSESTSDWWLKQSAAARKIFTDPQQPVVEVLKRLNRFLKEHHVEFIWGNGAAFDNAILRDLYSTFDVPYPIKYTGDMCVRTIKRLAGDMPKIPKYGTPHNALHDAIYESRVVQSAYQILRND